MSSTPKAWEQKVAHYLEYGNALKSSDAERKKIMDTVADLPAELANNIYTMLPGVLLPPIMEFPMECLAQTYSNGFRIPSYACHWMRDTFATTLDLVMQTLANVRLVTEEIRDDGDDDGDDDEEERYIKRHPGYAVDVSRAPISREAMATAILQTVIVEAEARFPTDDIRDDMYSPIPFALLDFAASITSLHLYMDMPDGCSWDQVQNQKMEYTKAGLEILKDWSPGLKVFHLDIIVHDIQRHGGRFRWPSLLESGDQENVQSQEEHVIGIFISIRKAGVKENSITYVDGMSGDTWRNDEWRLHDEVDARSWDEETIAAEMTGNGPKKYLL